MNHTNLPWRFQMLGSEGGRIYPDYGDIRERGKFIAVVNGRSTQEDQANGDFIVTAVNVHNGLVEVLEAIAQVDGACSVQDGIVCFEDGELIDLKALITKAKGGQP